MRFQLGVKSRVMIAALVGLAAAAGPVRAEEIIDVKIDFAKVVTLDRQADTIVIGNPGIADATVEDGRMVVLTGKAAGTTNLIVLDEAGKEMINAILRVSSNVEQLTTVFYGSQRHTFSCATVCEQVILVGDGEEVFATATEQIQGRQEFAGGQ